MTQDTAPTVTAPRSAPLRWTKWLFIGVLAVYLLTGSGQFQTVDAAQELSVALSMRHGQGFQSDFPVGPAGGTTPGRDGRTYAGHDLGSSLLYLPFTLIPGSVDQHAAAVPADPDSNDAVLLPSRRLYFAASFLAPLLGALIVLVFALVLRELGFDETTTVITALALAFTTTIWVYAHVSFDSTATALAVVGATWGAIRFEKRGHPRDALLAGVALGAAVLIRVDSVIMVPFLAAPVLWAAFKQSRNRSQRPLWSTLLLVMPIVVAAVGDLAYNWYRFGSITDNGHTDDGFLQYTPRLVDGFFGQVASPGKGLLVFSPLLIVALFRWRWFLRRHGTIAASIATATLATLLAHSAIVGWAGDQAWGARFTVPVVPLIAIPLARVVQEIRRSRIGIPVKITVVFLGAVGFVVQLTGVFTDFFAVVVSRRLRGFDTATSLVHPAYLDGLGVLWRAFSHAQPYPDLTAAWVDALHVARFDLWWVRSAQVSGWNLATVGIPVVLLATAVFGLLRLHRSLKPRSESAAGPDQQLTRPA